MIDENEKKITNEIKGIRLRVDNAIGSLFELIKNDMDKMSSKMVDPNDKNARYKDVISLLEGVDILTISAVTVFFDKLREEIDLIKDKKTDLFYLGDILDDSKNKVIKSLEIGFLDNPGLHKLLEENMKENKK